MDKASSSQRQHATRIGREQWRAVTELFDRCNGLSSSEREQLLTGVGTVIAAEVRSLLQNAGSGENSSESPADQLLTPPQLLPDQIGAYRIDRLLGQGGMGSVFLARRVGEFEQEVAVKLIRSDFGSGAHALETRFRQERQILASLQHPYIAHLIDGGTSNGQPYLVVEYIPGLRIDKYCDLNRLTIRQRIELFIKICGAVQYAHQNLIIHRDLKHANILVLEDGTPKLLDFGIAKLLRRDDVSSDLTNIAMKIFTPSYASPEQLRGDVVGTTSDVYSLGIMLYELLAGEKPYLVEGDSDLAMLDAICHQTPPSATEAIKRYSEQEREQRARERATTYFAWRKSLRNDLDLILAHAISADIGRRYQSVEQLASDLNRYLTSQPILARNDTWLYRTRKFWGRHRALVSVASLASMMLIVGGIVLWREYRVAVRQSKRAERRFDDLRALAHSNVTEVQDALDRVQGGTQVRALILQRAIQSLDSLAAEKDNDIELQRDLASAYLMVAQRLGNPASANLGNTAGANANYDRSIRIREAIVALPQANEKDRVQLIVVRYHKAIMQSSAGQMEAGRQTLTQAASASDAFFAGNPHDVTQALRLVSLTHRALADALFENGAGPSLADPAQGLRHGDIAVEAAQAAYTRDPKGLVSIANLINCKSSKAQQLFAAGQEEEGLKLQKSTLNFVNASKGILPAKDSDLLVHATYEYGIELANKDPRAALPWLDDALATVVAGRAADPVNIKLAGWYAIAMTTVGNVHRRAGEREKGMKMMAEGMKQLVILLTTTSATKGQLNYALATGHRGLGDDAVERGNLRQALSEYQSAERVYAEDAASIPEDLDVYLKRADNQLSVAAVEAKMGMAKQASASRVLATGYADRILRVHPDNPVAQTLKLNATALKF